MRIIAALLTFGVLLSMPAAYANTVQAIDEQTVSIELPEGDQSTNEPEERRITVGSWGPAQSDAATPLDYDTIDNTAQQNYGFDVNTVSSWVAPSPSEDAAVDRAVSPMPNVSWGVQANVANSFSHNVTNDNTSAYADITGGQQAVIAFGTSGSNTPLSADMSQSASPANLMQGSLSKTGLDNSANQAIKGFNFR